MIYIFLASALSQYFLKKEKKFKSWNQIQSIADPLWCCPDRGNFCFPRRKGAGDLRGWVASEELGPRETGTPG